MLAQYGALRHHGVMGNLITAREAAQLARRSRSQINRDAAAGRLPVAQQFPGYKGPRMFDAEQVAATYNLEQQQAAS
jgi:hypothetical protein